MLRFYTRIVVLLPLVESKEPKQPATVDAGNSAVTAHVGTRQFLFQLVFTNLYHAAITIPHNPAWP